MIVQILPFNSPAIGVPLRRDIFRFGEGIPTPTLATMAGGFLPPPVGASRPSTSIEPLSPSSRVVQPSAPSNVVDPSSGVVIRIPSAPFSFPSFMQSAQSGPSGSSSSIHGFPWNGLHIPPSTPYVGPSPAYVGMSSGNTNDLGHNF